jgi:ElaB/YqjD/DUF883 family membrane-anchored ribosome-binding protein
MDDFEAIKQQMEARRSSLAEKLEALECQVAESVQGVTSAVSNVKEVVEGTVESVKDKVESVKDSVEETVGAVKEQFDFQHQMDAHPWMMVGGAFAVGFLTGRLWPDIPMEMPFASGLRSPGPASRRSNGVHGNGASGNGGYRPQVVASPPEAEPEPKHSWFDSLLQQLSPDIDKLKGLALGAAVGFVRDYVKRTAPRDLGSHLASFFDSVTTKLGGQPLQDDLSTRRQSADFR